MEREYPPRYKLWEFVHSLSPEDVENERQAPATPCRGILKMRKKHELYRAYKQLLAG
ncbi:hypothetical protein GCM10023188_26020 [Pontibacter saemangeumensis]|uniref:Uncharacterized protein n=1 Tax=Pontibacter saemangeumensis TaxID=1084525 RepID=A0ABP8LTY2_9BACT